MSEVKAPAKTGGNKVIVNKSKGLRYVGGKKLLPDDKGVEFTSAEVEAAQANPAFVARLKAGEFEIK